MRYSCDGFTSLCHILHTDDEDGSSPKIFIKLRCGRTLHTSPEFLQNVDDLDVASVSSTISKFRKQVDTLSDADLSFLANPRSLSPLEQE